MDAIVSVTNDWGIGLAGQLLVRNRADMRRFVDLTMGGTVLMGRKTLESFPGGPLKGRRNVVLTRDESYAPEGVDVVHSASEVLEAVSGDEHVWLIGGESVYRLFLPQCERVYVTKNDVTLPADAWFPDLDEDERRRQLFLGYDTIHGCQTPLLYCEFRCALIERFRN